MRKYFVSILFLTALTYPTIGETSPFERMLMPGFGNDIIESVEHNFIFTGGDGESVLVSKINSTGDTIWERKFGLTSGTFPNNFGSDIIRISDDRYLITGNYDPGIG